MNTLTLEPMSYKEEIKKDELLTKLRIIKLVKKGYDKIDLACKFRCHRNTVGNIMKAFNRELGKKKKKKALNASLTREELKTLLAPLKNEEPVPEHHPSQVIEKQERGVEELYEKGLACLTYSSAPCLFTEKNPS